jgi:hypothetical protein
MSYDTYTDSNGTVTSFNYPLINDTAIGAETTDTLQNKTITSGTAGNLVSANQIVTSSTPVSIVGNSLSTGETIVSVNSSSGAWSGALDTLIFGIGDIPDPNICTGVTVTLTQDMYYANLTIAAGGTLVTNGFRVFVKGTATIDGQLSANGNDGVGQTAGTATNTSGSLGLGAAGGVGGASGGGAGSASSVGTQTMMGGRGGAGGKGSNNTTSAGAGGNSSVPKASNGGVQIWNDVYNAIRGQNIGGTKLNGGCGGGGGGGGYATVGGGGGGGAGVVLLVANTISGTGTISANGGAGADGSGSAGGGGGGGGGGAVVVIYNSITMNLANITASGGTGGAVGTGGIAGTAGNAGNVFLLSP